MTAKRPSLHHFFWRAWAPQVRGRGVFRPHLRPLRVVAMPGTRFEIAELLVLYQIELGEQFGDQSVRAAVIGKQIVPDAVAARPPKSLKAVETEEIARLLQLAPVAHLERGVEVAVGAGAHEIDGVVIR